MNRAAWRWLKLAKVQPDPYSLHILTLAQWGLENGAKGDWQPRDRHDLEMQLGLLWGATPARAMEWLFENVDAGDAEEQEADLLNSLKTANSPIRAAAEVLNAIWLTQQSQNPYLQTA
ncbi:MAG: hypothetical protein ACREDO_09970 [Methyloceanibacter sp.]